MDSRIGSIIELYVHSPIAFRDTTCLVPTWTLQWEIKVFTWDKNFTFLGHALLDMKI